MITANDLTQEITAAMNHPLWGELFTRVMAGTLTEDDIFLAQEFGQDRPDWIGVVAGGNPDYLRNVAAFAFDDFVATIMMRFPSGDPSRIPWLAFVNPLMIPHDN